MHRYALVIFDMDDVLVEYDIPLRMRLLSEMTGLAPDEVYARGWASGFEDMADAGHCPDGDSYLAAFNAALGSGLTRGQWVHARGTSMRPIARSLALARQLRGQVKTAVLTNNGPMVTEEITRLAPEVAEIFGADFHSSSEFGTRKPDPSIFTRFCALYGVHPSQALFIDDKSENAAGARLAGLHAHHFAGADGLEALFA